MNESPGQGEEELERAIEEAEAEILVVGCGGAGGNTVSRILEAGIEGAENVAVNTDAQDLLHTSANRKVLIGREVTGGLGAGNDPKLGKKAAVESKNSLKELLQGKDMVFVTCGLGGGTGTGASPVIADIASGFGALTVGVVTLPLEVEGRRRSENAKRGLRELRKTVDASVIIPDDNILKIAPDLPIGEAFRAADEILMSTIKGVTELITEPGLINLDFADVRTVLQDGGISQVGMGESDDEDRALEAAEEALENPLLETEVSEAEEALVNVTGPLDMSLDEAEIIADRVSVEVGPGINIVWGARVSEELKNSVRVMVLIPGASSPYDRGLEIERKEAKQKLEKKIKIIEKQPKEE